MPDRDDPVVMAQIGAAHGVRGSVKLTVFAAEPLALKRYNPFTASDGRTLKLKAVRVVGKGVVADIDGVADRNGAEALKGLVLSVPRHRLPAPEEDEFYYVDLIGLEARLSGGAVLGIVRGVADHGAGDVLEVEGERTVLVPFTRAVVPEVSLAGGYLVVDPPPGLLEDEAPPPEAAVDDGP